MIEWQTDDWDPALRFWTLPYGTALPQWQRTVDTSLPSIMAALEFATQPDKWTDRATTVTDAGGWLEPDDLAWSLIAAGNADQPTIDTANNVVLQEIRQLQVLMEDDRDRYLAEIERQADGLSGYIVSFMAIDPRRYPWTMELIATGLAIGNIAYFYCKAHFKRVRPSFLCPGLMPAFGPPQHPAFPSGHSFLGHFIALLLLEIPAVANKFGIFTTLGQPGKAPAPVDPATGIKALAGTEPIASPLLWLAQRLAKNRERLGVHYCSDSMGSRHIAAGIWNALLHDPKPIVSPTLQTILARAKAEWV